MGETCNEGKIAVFKKGTLNRNLSHVCHIILQREGISIGTKTCRQSRSLTGPV